MIESLIPIGSTYAQDIDNLILLIGALSGFWFILSEFVFFYFIFRYRKKEGVKALYVDGSNKDHKRWITIPHLLVLVCDVFIVVGAVRVWVDVKQTIPADDPACIEEVTKACTAAGTAAAECSKSATTECAPRTVRIIAQQWQWSFVHPGPDNVLDTEDDIETAEDLHIERGRTYHYELTSRDVLHSFSVPVFRLKQDAIPGRFIRGWFKPTLEGLWDIQCTEMCGIGHGLMPARLHVENSAEHDAWMKDPNAALAARGN
jgi:cytochrome c oxidase subunit 2